MSARLESKVATLTVGELEAFLAETRKHSLAADHEIRVVENPKDGGFVIQTDIVVVKRLIAPAPVKQKTPAMRGARKGKK